MQILEWLNNNEGVVTVSIFIITIIFAWVTGIWKWIWNSISKSNKAKKIICAWRVDAHTETDDFIEYKFGPSFHNKNDEIVKDFWINFSTSGFDLSLEATPQMIRFNGWNMRNESLNLTLNDNEKFAPQNYLEPFMIIIKLRKDLPKHGAWLYISYGVSNSPKNEMYYCLSYFELKKFINGPKHSTKNFLEYVGAKGFGKLRTKIIRIFWK